MKIVHDGKFVAKMLKLLNVLCISLYLVYGIFSAERENQSQLTWSRGCKFF